MSGMGGKHPSVAISVDLLQTQSFVIPFLFKNLRRKKTERWIRIICVDKRYTIFSKYE
jgi:hypothetical protein